MNLRICIFIEVLLLLGINSDHVTICTYALCLQFKCFKQDCTLNKRVIAMNFEWSFLTIE